MDPVLAHFVADWVFQSQWMASEKVKAARAAVAHVVVYGIVFGLLVRPSWAALAVIVGSHYLIDRYRLARHVNWAANFIAPWHRALVPGTGEDDPRTGIALHRWRSTNPPWSECKTYGSPPGVPDHIGFIVMVAVDQIMHLALNGAALRWL